MAPAMQHTPVLVEEVYQGLFEGRNGTGLCMFDGTLGAAGHAKEFLSRRPDLKYVAVDRDPQAVANAQAVLSEYAHRFTALQRSFSELDAIADAHGRSDSYGEFRGFDALLLDLGYSSEQLDRSGRGFRFQADEPLDMRLDPGAELSAYSVLNEYSEASLRGVFKRGGMTRYASKLAAAVVEARPLESTYAFSELCEQVIPRFERRDGVTRSRGHHPATIPFQAVRIEVNAERNALRGFLDAVERRVLPGGRLAVISFHSDEDRMVARAMREWTRSDAPVSPDARELPRGSMRLLTPKPIRPSDKECNENSRARSALLRVCEKIT